jgi:hypothetical protein
MLLQMMGKLLLQCEKVKNVMKSPPATETLVHYPLPFARLDKNPDPTSPLKNLLLLEMRLWLAQWEESQAVAVDPRVVETSLVLAQNSSCFSIAHLANPRLFLCAVLSSSGHSLSEQELVLRLKTDSTSNAAAQSDLGVWVVGLYLFGGARWTDNEEGIVMEETGAAGQDLGSVLVTPAMTEDLSNVLYVKIPVYGSADGRYICTVRIRSKRLEPLAARNVKIIVRPSQ